MILFVRYIFLMFYANFVTPVFQENTSKPLLKKRIEAMKRREKTEMEKLNKIRKKNFDRQVEIYKINKQLKNPISDEMNNKVDKLDKKINELEFRIEDSDKLLQFYDKIISKFNGEKDKNKNEHLKKKTPRAKSRLTKVKYLTPMERIQKIQRSTTTMKNRIILPPLSLSSENKKIIQRIEEKFGTSNPEEIFEKINNLRSLQKNLKRKIALNVVIEDAYEKKKENIKYRGTKEGELMEKLKSTKIKIYDTKLELIDMEETNEELTKEIDNLYGSLTTDRKERDTLSAIRWVADYAISQLTEVESRIDELESPSDKTTTFRFDAIPSIPIGRTMFAPSTRASRKAYPAMTTMRRGDEADNVDNELNLFGATIGHIFIDRFSSAYVKFNTPLTNDCYDELEYPDPSPESESAANETFDKILERMFVEYSEYKELLPYTMYTDKEIIDINENLLAFLSSRDTLITAFTETFDINYTLDFFREKFPIDSTVICWIIHDLILFTDIGEHVNEIIKIAEPFFNEDVNDFGSNVSNQMAWAAALSACFEPSDNVSNNSKLSEMVSCNFIIEPNLEIDSEITRVRILILLDLARHTPEYFISSAALQNQYTSFLLQYMSECNGNESCFKTGALFFCYCFQLLDEESVMWHFAIFFHTLVKALANSSINGEIIASCLLALRSVVEKRHKWNYNQIKSLYLLNNALKQIELEAYPNGHIYHKKSVQINKTVSIKDIPSLSLDSVIPTLNFDNPKLQLHFQPKAEKSDEDDLKSDEDSDENAYLSKRKFYPVYVSDKVHVHIVELIFSIVIDHRLHKFDIEFVDQFPHVNVKPNVLYPIMKHMENKYNSYLMEDFSEEFMPPPSLGEPDSARAENFRSFNMGTQALGLFSMMNTNSDEDNKEVPSLSLNETNIISNELPNVLAFQRKDIIHHKEDYQRMLRLTMPSLFKPSMYSNGKHIASGAFGVVMMAPPKVEGEAPHAVKILQKSTNEFDDPHLFEVFTEVSILDLCKGDRRVTQLIDFGCTSSSYYIVMEYYPKTLKAWRKSFIDKPPPILSMLRVYREFLIAAKVLVDRRINHFDIKCDNVMLDRNGLPALSDFGESMCYKDERNCYTLLNKGTEWIKSPEMLSIALTSTVTNPKFDRRKKNGAGPESDIWSIGCLFFELLTGHFLFATTDWSYFYTRVTSEGPICEPKDKKELEDIGCKNAVAFLEFVLKRSVITRPNLEQITSKFDELFPEAKTGPLPQIT